MSRCDRCLDKGLIRVQYQQEEGFDLAVCNCRTGKWWKQKGMLRAETARWDRKPVQIGRLEEFFPELK